MERLDGKRAHAILWPRLTAKREKAMLLGLHLPHREKRVVEEGLEELKGLAVTAGADVIGVEITKRASPHPAFYIGSGKAEEIKDICETRGIDIVIFNEDLTPTQVRNLQDVLGRKVIDRTELILDIFALHAHSYEGQKEVELAQLEYMQTRLVHAWTHLSRQEGGIGTRGPGERQLEIDRRRLKTQIVRLKEDLKEIASRRQLQQYHRKRTGLPLISIIGYTNAGKTTLFNRLTESHLPVEDGLFTTLDTKIKKFPLPNKQPVLLSDTVGFINKLPHHLVEAFKSTLEEVKQADALLHVIDGNARQIEEQYSVVLDILEKLGIKDKAMISVINKTDLVGDEAAKNRLARKFPYSVTISARDGAGIEELIYKIQLMLQRFRQEVSLFIPAELYIQISKIYRLGNVRDIKYTLKGAKLTAQLPVRVIDELEREPGIKVVR